MHSPLPRKSNSRTFGMPAHTPLFAALAFSMCALGPTPAGAMTWPVGKCGDMAGKGGDTLRIAIGKAANGDTVDMGPLPLTCSTITLTGGEISIGVANLTVQGPSGRSVVVSGNNVGRVFYDSAGGGLLTLSGFEVAYGQTVGKGGCIYATGDLYLSAMTASHCHADSSGGAAWGKGNVKVAHSTIYSNTAGSASSNGGGGGIGVLQGNLQMSDSIVTGNSSRDLGGGIYNRGSGNFTIESTSITNNHGGGGGGIISGGGTLKVTNVVIDHNSSTGEGGGLWASGIAEVTATMISNNSATGRGAGIFTTGTELYVTASTIANNGSADTMFGGGIAAILYGSNKIGPDTSYVTIKNSTISGNQAQAAGGVRVALVYSNDTAHFSVSNSTIAFNRSLIVANAAGLYTSVTDTNLESSIIVHNSPRDLEAEPLPHFLTGANNIIMNATEMPVGTWTTDPHLAPLALHGGVLPTHAFAANSIATDHGDDPLKLDFDERGAGFARTVGGTTDIGAYERQVDDDELFYDGFGFD
jgi:hypothetical protein